MNQTISSDPFLFLIDLQISESVLKSTFELLVQGREYARKAKRTDWDFATEISELRNVGLTFNDLRLFLINGILAQAREVPCSETNQRMFMAQPGLRFTHRTCFILTDKGTQLAQKYIHCQPKNSEAAKPLWDPNRLELHCHQQLVKRYRVPSRNQVAILNAFQEDNWPARIDDPIPPDPDRCSKRRLLDTIKNLNRNHKYRCIRFHGDGTGEGVLWSWQQSS